MVGMLYLFTGIMSLYWTLLTLRDVYGPPRMLTAFLIPMALRTLAQYPDGIVAELPTLLATKAFVLALVLTSLAVSTLQRMRAHSAGPNPK